MPSRPKYYLYGVCADRGRGNFSSRRRPARTVPEMRSKRNLRDANRNSKNYCRHIPALLSDEDGSSAAAADLKPLQTTCICSF